MLTKPILKIWLLSVNFEKFTSITFCGDQSQLFKRSTVIGQFIEVSFSKLNGQQPNFQECICLH